MMFRFMPVSVVVVISSLLGSVVVIIILEIVEFISIGVFVLKSSIGCQIGRFVVSIVVRGSIGIATAAVVVFSGRQRLGKALDHVGGPDPQHGCGNVHSGTTAPGAFVLVAQVAAPRQKGQGLCNKTQQTRPKQAIKGWQLKGDAARTQGNTHNDEPHANGQGGHGLAGIPHAIAAEELFLFVRFVPGTLSIRGRFHRSDLP
mmetsp:Transcript_2941/g.4654  ORF Transcript_2941/g.4654 Transcript_2941/m.4654 type:complete len:202 (+) Transcript_2941:410-1015(+)